MSAFTQSHNQWALDQLGAPGQDTETAVEMVATRHRVVLSNGHAVTVEVIRPANAEPWGLADQIALRAILDVAAAASDDDPSPGLLS